MDKHGNKGGMRFGEIAVILVVAVVLLALALPSLRHSRNAAKNTDTVVANLRRIEAAKEQYASDHHKEPGTKVSMKDLVKNGYLAAEPKPVGGGAYVVNAIGTPAEFDEDAKSASDTHDQDP